MKTYSYGVQTGLSNGLKLGANQRLMLGRGFNDGVALSIGVNSTNPPAISEEGVISDAFLHMGRLSKDNKADVSRGALIHISTRNQDRKAFRDGEVEIFSGEGTVHSLASGSGKRGAEGSHPTKWIDVLYVINPGGLVLVKPEGTLSNDWVFIEHAGPAGQLKAIPFNDYRDPVKAVMPHERPAAPVVAVPIAPQPILTAQQVRQLAIQRVEYRMIPAKYVGRLLAKLGVKSQLAREFSNTARPAQVGFVVLHHILFDRILDRIRKSSRLGNELRGVVMGYIPPLELAAAA